MVRRRWLSVGEAADRLAVPASVVVAAIDGGELPARRGRQGWLVSEHCLSEWAVSCPAGGYTVRGDRYVSADRRPHLELLASLPLGDAEIASALGVAVWRVARWRQRGVPNLYVRRLRDLAAATPPDP